MHAFARQRQSAREVAALYKSCEESECAWDASEGRAAMAEGLTFGGAVPESFYDHATGAGTRGSELAFRYKWLRESFRNAKNPEQRLRVFAEWLWTELKIPPAKSLGESVVKQLRRAEEDGLSHIPFNDVRYALVVEAWLPYAERLFQDGRQTPRRAAGAELMALGYEKSAVELFLSKRWRSTVAFVCDWLAQRGVAAVKPRKNGDMARTLRNSYTKIFGAGKRRVSPIVTYFLRTRRAAP